jgi:hypothetical protein
MIHVTEHAKDALLTAKQTARIDDPSVGLRLSFRRSGRLGLVPDREKAGDDVVRHQDATVLLVDPQMAALVVSGRILDCRRTGDGEIGFFLRRRTLGDRPSFAA